ncbi:phage virion morphogenesis protein [Pseudomonas sp. LAIL14HWK12:I2]|uniref:phage virion morphogenesis protein n=1 Tax=unclassified Pseudomonas TaxID=196821 RepID=UPI0010676987|nr:phage virion morphogenesis protein [Pseudomonas sp. LAIL14HWK12:I2]TFA86114.1 phage virion morphogenesis protein [Pseudomonas sp. LAIL14HWK12:I2]
MTAPTLSLDIRGLLSAQQHLQLLSLPPNKRRRVLKNAGSRLATQNRKRTRSQRNLDGSAFAARKTGRKRKMLRGLSRGLKVLSTTTNQSVLGWRQRPLSRIAAEHQSGQTEIMTPGKIRRRAKNPKNDAPATKRLARALLKAGYQIRQGEIWVQPGADWIVANLKKGQAGLILDRLQGAPKKQSWKIVLPARDALGADAAGVREMLGTVLQQVLHSPK